MNKFEDIIHGLQEDMDVPTDVWQAYIGTLYQLPDKAVVSGPKPQRHSWAKYGATAAAVTALGLGICFANPTLAAKIPFLGTIFQEIQQLVTFSGKYDSKAQTLSGTEGNSSAASMIPDSSVSGLSAESTMVDNNPGTEDAEENWKEDAIASPASVTNSGVTVTPSEVYCDGNSIFLTVQITIDQGGLENLPGNSLYLNGNWQIQGNETQEDLFFYLDGKATDDHTFIGMMKLDSGTENLLSDGVAEIMLTRIGYDDMNMMDVEDISASHKIDGTWTFRIPFTVDQETAGFIAIDRSKNGYHLDRVFVSPYQVISYTDVPYSENDITRQEFEKAMAQKSDSDQAPGITYEEYMETMGRTYEYCSTLIFNQDGQMLTPVEDFWGRAVFAVQDTDLSNLYLYVFDNNDAYIQMSIEGLSSDAADMAVISAQVDISAD